MKKSVATALLLALLLTLAGCKNIGKPAEGDGTSSAGTETSDGKESLPAGGPTDGAGSSTESTGGDGETAGGESQEPPQDSGLTVALTASPSASVFAALADEDRQVLAGGAESLKAGTADAAVLTVSEAARLYRESGGSVNVAALLSSGGWVIAEKGTGIDGVLGLGGKTVYAPEDAGEAMAVLGCIAGEYGFEVGKNLKIEAVSDPENRDVALLPEGGTGAGQRTALSLLSEWEYATGRELLPGLCLVVRSDMEDGTLKELLEASSAVCAGAADTDYTEYLYLSGEGELRGALEDYLELLYGADSAVIGGSIPDDGFYR